jgi:hypothetical protein
MRVAWLVLSALCLVILGSCQQEAATSTPVSAAVIERPNLAADISLLTLARNPVAYEGETLLLSGDYRPLPLPVCADETHLSPATWVLSDDNIEIMVAGFDSALRDLVPPGQALEVEGNWQKWDGPVGCGRRAPAQTIWYLQLTNILSPNPLVASLLITPSRAAPASSGAAVGDIATTSVMTATTDSGVTTSAIPAATPTLSGTPTPGALATPTSMVSATVIATVTPFPTFTPTVTPSMTPTGTATLARRTPTPTSTSTSSGGSTPSPTPTIDTGDPIVVDYDDLSKRTVGRSSVQEWQFYAARDWSIVLSVAPDSDLDVALELFDPDEESVVSSDAGGSGQIETIDKPDLPSSGVYTLKINSVGGTSGSYALLLQDDSALPFVSFQGNLRYGQEQQGTVPDEEQHLWNFSGTAGEIVSFRVTAITQGNLRLFLNNHEGQEVEDDIEDNKPYPLSATGLYTIGIGEYDLEQLNYSIVIEQAP